VKFKGNYNLHAIILNNISFNKSQIVKNSIDPQAHCQYALNCWCSVFTGCCV